MGRHEKIKEVEGRVRSSKIYHEWQRMNLASSCLTCNSTESLNVHHVVELYHILLGLWKLYGDPEAVLSHAVAMHENDNCDSVTLCKSCHKKHHPARRILFDENVQIADWVVYPRKIPGPFLNNSKVASESGLTLVDVQLLGALGWYILNGHLEHRMIEAKRRALARTMGKAPNTSFNRCLERSLGNLEAMNLILGSHFDGPRVEIHMSPAYLAQLEESPWFLSVPDLQTRKMPVFALRWFLGLQSRRVYKIGFKKLAVHLGIKTDTPAVMRRSVMNSIDEIHWAKAEFDGKTFTFVTKRRGSVPIWTLRSILADAIEQGR